MLYLPKQVCHADEESNHQNCDQYAQNYNGYILPPRMLVSAWQDFIRDNILFTKT